MDKKIVLLILFLSAYSFCFAQSNETITVVTYYPSPYGTYNELSANKVIVGVGTSAPSENGMMAFAGRASDPSGVEGNLYYNNSTHEFKYRNNTAWQTFGQAGNGL